ncbi:hypothetical protein [Spirillospora albida]|uniref:hypothetical protein n=1 Tax=Spirillospora albida TaxID=58123 RepID=UPI0004BF9DFC|nr:hypothetical protein [Spirillospora albida]
MTAKTTEDATPAGEGDETPAVTEPSEEGAEARPAKRKRRVRVIEVLDDEDLDEVLDAIDAEDEEDEAEAPAAPKARPAAKPAAVAKPKPKKAPVEVEVEADEDEDEDEDEEPARKRAPEPVADRPAFLGMGRTQAIVVVVLVALLASLAVWQWTRASGLASDESEREEIAKVASAYGDVAFNYNASNYQAQMAKTQRLLAGDLLDEFNQSTRQSLTETFKANPEVTLTSKTDKVFVGDVTDRFAMAVISVDVQLSSKSGSKASPATLLRLALSKIDGSWKITKQYPSGVNDQNQQQQLGQLPVGGASGTPAPSTSAKPKD